MLPSMRDHNTGHVAEQAHEAHATTTNAGTAATPA